MNNNYDKVRTSKNELEAILADPQASLVEERLDSEDLGTDAAFELLDGVAGITQGVERSTTEDGTTVERKTFYDPETLFDMYRNGKYFDPQLDDAELMNKIWKDEMGEDGDWDPNSAEMRQLAETWLIDKSIADNLPMDRLTKVTKKPVDTDDNSNQTQKIILNDYLNKIDKLEFEGAENLGPVEQDRGYFNLDVVSEQLSRPPFNINISKSEGADVGSLQNILGNKLPYTNAIGSANLGNYAYVVGAIRRDETECIYWFVTSQTKNLVIEYNQTNNTVTPVVVDTLNVLGFKRYNLITGIEILDDFLIGLMITQSQK